MNEQQQKILIVDDESTNIDILLEIFKGRCTAVVAKNGGQALNLLDRQNVDLILLDIMMPGMDGYETCRRLKAQASTREIPLIFITAKTEDGDEAKGLAMGAVDYITKPFCATVVRARVQTHLRLRQAYEKLARQNAELERSATLREHVERISRHDLKTPLGGIVNYPSMLIEKLDPDPASKRMLDAIERSGYQILDLINLSLDLYKMEMGTYEFQPAPTDFVAVIAKVKRDLDSLAEYQGIAIKPLLHGKPIQNGAQFMVAGNAMLCYSLLANLTKNAIEAAPEDCDITLSLSLQQDRSELQVHNPGVVPKAILADFFGKYKTSGKAGGTGLGTYSAKLITEAQGGNIQVNSTETAGTTLHVLLNTWPSDEQDILE